MYDSQDLTIFQASAHEYCGGVVLHFVPTDLGQKREYFPARVHRGRYLCSPARFELPNPPT